MPGEDQEELMLHEAKLEAQKRWGEVCEAASVHVKSLSTCGLDGGTADAASLPRLNALAQDCLASLRSLQRQFDLLAHQSISVEERAACMKVLETWKAEYQNLHAALRSANLQAKANIQQAAKSERDLLLGGGEEATNLRRNLQTQAGMSAAAESVTESLRRTRQMMVQELERGANTLITLDESTTTLRKADSEYKGQRSLLNTTRGLLSALQRQDVLDRIILVVGFIVFSAVVTFVFNQRIGLFKMHRAAPHLYGEHKPHAMMSSVSNDVPTEGAAGGVLPHHRPPSTGGENKVPEFLHKEHHPPSTGRENEVPEFLHKEPEVCASSDACSTADPSGSELTRHTEL